MATPIKPLRLSSSERSSFRNPSKDPGDEFRYIAPRTFVLITIGLISGLGLIWLLGTGIFEWLTDGKVICIIAAWGLLGIMLLLNRMLLLKGKARAYMTIAVFLLVLFAIILGSTQHDFSRY